MQSYSYVGLDIHKNSLVYCMKAADGAILDEGTIRATAQDLRRWARTLKGRWHGAMEATLFTGWVYDTLEPHAASLAVGHPFMLKAITASKRKNDRLDARTLADLLRCDLFPRSYMPPQYIREPRRVLRYRSLIVQEATRMKNKTAGLLLEVGAQYTKSKLHGKRYFTSLMDELTEVPASVRGLLEITHGQAGLFEALQKRLLKELLEHPQLTERVERLQSIEGVGPVTALTWALEVGEPERFRTVKNAVSYCGLCSAQIESAGKARRSPLSKQRNKYLQTTLIEAAKLAPRWNPQLAEVYDQERERGANHNRATLAVARKLVAYLLYVDKSGQAFVRRDAA